MSWLLYTVLWWTLVYTCLFQSWFPWCICPILGLLGRMTVLFSVFEGISTLLSLVHVLIYIPNKNAGVFSSLYTLSSIDCWKFGGTAILTSVRWNLIGLLICLSLISSDAEHLSICLMAISMPSSEKCPFRSLAHFLNWVVWVFWYWTAWATFMF